MLKRLSKSLTLRRFAGRALARYLTFVHRSSRIVMEPSDLHARIRADYPVIIATWHGQHFLVPLARADDMEARVMVSRSADGEINAAAAEQMGVGTIRASGGRTGAQTRRRGGVRGFLECLRALEAGHSIALTADVPKGPARVAGAGIVMLAQHSGRPIVPIAYATSRRITINSAWDKASVNLPFSRAAVVGGEPMRVPTDADDIALESYGAALTASLNTVTARAYAIVDRHDVDGRDG